MDQFLIYFVFIVKGRIAGSLTNAGLFINIHLILLFSMTIIDFYAALVSGKLAATFYSF